LPRRVLKSLEYFVNLTTLFARSTVNRPDVIHVQFLPMLEIGLPCELWLLATLRRMGVKIVCTIHNVLPHDGAHRRREAFRRMYDLADHLICHDPVAREKLIQEFGLRPERISVIEHGPLLTNIHAPSGGVLPNSPEAAKRECVVLWQGILRPYKGVGFLLDAWKQVCNAGVRARLLIVGGGDDRVAREIRERIAALDLAETVDFDARFVSIEELERLHRTADVLVYPYSSVTTSGALMTGIGYGKATIASRLPAFEQVLRHEENGLLVPYGDVDAFREALCRLIADAGLRNRLGEQLRQSMTASPTWESIAARTAACYASL
jgi:glycosyltransferase involved in cell wall biosynthesis